MSSDDLGGTSTRLFAPYSTVFDSLVGQSVTRLAMNQSTVAVFFENRTKLHLECEWLYQAASGDLIDRQTDFAERICFGLWQIVGKTIGRFAFSNSPMPTFIMEMSDGSSLIVRSNDDAREDWQLVSYYGHYQIICMGTEITDV